MIFINQYRIEAVTSREKLKEAEDLVFTKYKEKKFCSDRFEVQKSLRKKNKITLGIYENNNLCATLTLAFDLPEKKLPSEHLYQEELDYYRIQGHKLVEITKLSSVVGKEDALYYLFILSFLFTQKVLYSDMIALIEPHHLSYYRSKFNFEIIGDEKKDFKAEGASSLLISLNVTNAIKEVLLFKNKRRNKDLLLTLMNLEFIDQFKTFIVNELESLDLKEELLCV
jgi:hypothetical protein